MDVGGDQLGALGGGDSDCHQSSANSSDGTNAPNYACEVLGQGGGNDDKVSDYAHDGNDSESNATNQGYSKHEACTFPVNNAFHDLSGISDLSDDSSSLCPPSTSTDIIATNGAELFALELTDGICTKYSVEHNEWCESKLDMFGDVMTEREYLEDMVLTYDKKSNCMWICYKYKGLLKINLNSAEVTHLDVELPELEYPAILMVGDILHIVCCDFEQGHMTHITVDTITHKMTQNDYTSSNLDGYQGTFSFFCEKLIFSLSTNQLYMFGSGGVSNSRDCDGTGNVLFKYSLETQKWTSAKTTNLNSFGVEFYEASIVLSNDERYVFALRGRSAVTDGGDTHSNKLVVYDMANNIMRCCSLKLPPRGNRFRCEGVILRYRWEESLLSVGYVRKLLQSPDLNGLTLPGDLMYFISQWLAIEFIHVVETYSRSGQHFRVNVDSIIESLQ